MKFLRITYKLITLILLCISAVGIMFVYSLSSDKSSPNAKQIAYRKKWLQQVVKVIGLEVVVNRNDSNQNVSNDELAKDNLSANTNNINKQSALWVSNHISWMDIVVIGSQGVGFLSKKEVRQWPLIGWLGDKGGTVFIDRGGKNASQVAAKAIAKKINNGDSILVFPEGTTGSGENVMRFHARIFAPALDHQLLVQPISIRYLDQNGQPHPRAVWLDHSFMHNLLGVLASSNMRVEVNFLPIVDAKAFSGRRQLAELVENQIRDVLLSSSALKSI